MRYGMRWYEWYQYKIKIEVNNGLHFFRNCTTYIIDADQKWVEMIMNYKDVMDLWFVWMPVLFILIKYLKGVVDGWND